MCGRKKRDTHRGVRKRSGFAIRVNGKTKERTISFVAEMKSRHSH